MINASISNNSSQTEIEIDQIFELQQQYQYEVARTTAKDRIAKLRKLERVILKYRSEIKDALHNDFQKPGVETDMSETYVVLREIKTTVGMLRKWMRPHRVGTPLALLGSRSYIHYEPKGVVLIISPWNFPINLTLYPLVSAVAAGNCVIVKPSEYTQHSAAIMRKIINEVFAEEEVAFVEGGVEVSQHLLSKPFNHIFFTGSPQVGKIVMEAAAKHLTSVTLELGGKSPTIIDESANISQAADRITVAKFINAGQTCIAPDYILVHESKKDAFVKAMQKSLAKMYDNQKQEDYANIINEKHYKHVTSLLEDAITQGAKVVHGGETDADLHRVRPTVLVDVPLEADIMQEEIFGPLLPILTFKNLAEAIEIIQGKEKPLALYIYATKQKNIDYLLQNTRAGGTCINQSVLHFMNDSLPFGGSNNSGIGKGHGWYGFQEFSNARGVLRQMLPGATDLLKPPFNDFKKRIVDFTMRWL